MGAKIDFHFISSSSSPQTPSQIVLAPMEGVMDPVMREVISEYNPECFLFCVTEFIRVTDRVLPASTFFRYAPELKHGCKTLSGTPLVVQLLGGNADMLAENAALACDLGAKAIDLNFGCPAPTVNRHDGGATLLQYPERISKIVSTVRGKVPPAIPVSAKIRLGFADPQACLENARRIQDAGASWLTVHCRTKTDAYKPPAFWEWIPKLREINSLPIFVNGEIWNLSDLNECKAQSRENRFMIGRGILSDPFLGLKISKFNLESEELSKNFSKESWDYEGVFQILKDFSERSSRYYSAKEKTSVTPRFRDPTFRDPTFRDPTFKDSTSEETDSAKQGSHPGTARRLKQWLRFLALKHEFYQNLFQEIKTFERSDLILDRLEAATEEVCHHDCNY